MKKEPNIDSIERLFFSLYDSFEDKNAYLCLYYYFFEGMTYQAIAEDIFSNELSSSDVSRIISQYIQ